MHECSLVISELCKNLQRSHCVENQVILMGSLVVVISFSSYAQPPIFLFRICFYKPLFKDPPLYYVAKAQFLSYGITDPFIYLYKQLSLASFISHSYFLWHREEFSITEVSLSTIRQWMKGKKGWNPNLRELMWPHKECRSITLHITSFKIQIQNIMLDTPFF